MKLLTTIILSYSIAGSAFSQDAAQAARRTAPSPVTADVAAVSPALDKYSKNAVHGELWKRPGLTPRDRSIVTLAVLVARNQSSELPFYLNRALDNGVAPKEISELITHLAFYSGWGDAMAAVSVTKQVFAARGIRADQLPAASPKLLDLNVAAEAAREARVQKMAGPVSAGLVQYTRELLFNDLWLRPDLAPRDRSLVTVSALIASGQMEQLTAHLNIGMDNGLTRAQLAEVITHTAFHAGWPRAFSAVGVLGKVLESRSTPK